MKALSAAALAAVLLTTAAPASADPATGLDPFVQAKAMQRGVNVLGYDPLWTDPTRARFQMRHFKAIHEGGFQTVRINLQAFEHMDAKNQLDPRWLATLDTVVHAALDQGLNVILDEHDFNICAKDAAACEPRLTAFWRQVGERYRDAPDRVMFELLNEPNGQLDDTRWNRLLAVELAEVRRTNPVRNLIVGPAFWNSLDHLGALRLPEADRHLIVSFHYYTPMEFTHQGASWVPQYAKTVGLQWGSAKDIERLHQDFLTVDRWAIAHNRPIFLGEFGAYDKADMDSRVRYTWAVSRAAERRGWAWAYWQFDPDFVLWDMKADTWVRPIWKALTPAS